jgi:hypothetical protein
MEERVAVRKRGGGLGERDGHAWIARTGHRHGWDGDLQHGDLQNGDLQLSAN